MKKIIFTTLQIVVTLAILVWVFHDPKKRADMAHALAQADKTWILAGILAYGVVEILAAIRWQILLRVQGISLGWWRLTALLMIGIFFNLFMPGGTGGDVIKTYFLLKETPGKKAQALLAVLMDRLIGLLGLIFLTAIIIGLRYDWLTQVEVTRNLTWTLLAILAASLAGIGFSFVVTGFGLMHKLPSRMPFHDKFVELSVAYNLYARAWPASLLAFATSIGVHIASFYVFFFAGKALGAQASFWDFAGVMPIINTIASLPISVGGAGVREKLFEEMLGKLCNIDPAVAVVISLTGFMVLVFWAVVGGIIYVFYRPSEHVKMSEITHTVAALEHEIAESE
ncbi:MAG: glycosyltransferase 2 family protein [Chthoniobacter sp.]|nr:glycosyltransferase 2 family protein [Chthoniobacter sp.]